MKILIVDDEVIIRTGLATVIKWEELGFTLLPPADSAEEALRIMAGNPPDILLTDIRMNGMSGLELAKRVKQAYPNMEIVILSGYDDFAYVQEALRDGVADYLLKSSRPDEIAKSIMQIKLRIERRQRTSLADNQRESAYREAVIEHLIADGTAGSGYDDFMNEPVIREFLGSGAAGAGFRILVLGADGWENSSFYRNLLLFAVRNALNEKVPCLSLLQKERILAVVKGDIGNLRLNQDFEAIAKLLKCRIFAAAGPKVSELDQLPLSYQGALEAYAYRGFPTVGAFVDYAEVSGRQGIRTVCTMEEEGELAVHLKDGDKLALRRWVGKLVAGRMSDPESTPSSMQAFLNAVGIAASRWLERALHSMGVGEEYVRPDWTECPLSDQPEERLFEQLQRLMMFYRDKAGTDRTTYIQRALAYIRENLDGELSLQQVADYVHLNPSYFSALFRQELGCTYIEFVKRERIRKAGILLKETDAKISEVAEAIGYSDVKYFVQLFKKYTGATPTDFRNQI